MNNRDYFCKENISFKSTGTISNNNTGRKLTESVLSYFLFEDVQSKPSTCMGKQLIKRYLP